MHVDTVDWFKELYKITVAKSGALTKEEVELIRNWSNLTDILLPEYLALRRRYGIESDAGAKLAWELLLAIHSGEEQKARAIRERLLTERERQYPEVSEALHVTLHPTSSGFKLSDIPKDLETIKVKHHLKGKLINKEWKIIHVPAKLFYDLDGPSFNEQVEYQVVETEPTEIVEVTVNTELEIK